MVLSSWTYLAEARGPGVDIDSSQVVGFQGASVAVDAGQVDDLLPRTLDKKTIKVKHWIWIC